MEDAYTYYVLLLKIPESIFWNADISFLLGVVEDKSAFDAWESYASEKERQRTAKRSGRRH